VRLLRGSEPGRINIRGVAFDESLKEFCRSNGGGLINYSPLEEMIYSFMAWISLSGQRHLIIAIFSN